MHAVLIYHAHTPCACAHMRTCTTKSHDMSQNIKLDDDDDNDDDDDDDESSTTMMMTITSANFEQRLRNPAEAPKLSGRS